jgi:hypothetical protein
VQPLGRPERSSVRRRICITPLPVPPPAGGAGQPACGATLVALYANSCVFRGEEVLLIDSPSPSIRPRPRFSRSGASFFRRVPQSHASQLSNDRPALAALIQTRCAAADARRWQAMDRCASHRAPGGMARSSHPTSAAGRNSYLWDVWRIACPCLEKWFHISRTWKYRKR